MKHQHTVLPKKFLPRGAYRTTLDDGRRVWVIGGKIFPSKRAYFEWVEAQRDLAALIDKGAVAAPTKDDTSDSEESQTAQAIPVEIESMESEALNV